jgi:putative methanogenesis marker protein 8
MVKHVIEVAKTRVVIVNGKVVEVAEPVIKYCPLRRTLYSAESETKETIRQTVERNIQKYGLFTPNRIIESNSLEVLFGASEMIYCALKNGILDAAVIVCEGAGTVITSDAKIAQGIGMHLTGIIYTEPIPELIARLRARDCYVLTDGAEINQVEGVKKAVELGYKRIAVTVAGENIADVKRIREEEKQGVAIAILAVHTTGVTEQEAELMAKECDAIWGCASKYVREICGKQAIMQIGVKIPVFILSSRGKQIALERIKELRGGEGEGEGILISRATLPVTGESPRPLR